MDFKFEEKEPNYGVDFALSAKLTLPCGHDVMHSCICREYRDKGQDINQLREMARKRLAYWFETRIPRHDCASVSDSNPNGIVPKEERTKAAQTV